MGVSELYHFYVLTEIELYHEMEHDVKNNFHAIDDMISTLHEWGDSS